MVDKFKDVFEDRLFNEAVKAGLSESDIQLAASILMFEVVMSDGHVDRMEIAEMVEILRDQFDLGGERIGELLESVRTAEGLKLNMAEFTMNLRKHWNQDQRLQLLKNLWQIAIADRVIDDRERAMIDQIAQQLDLPAEDISTAQMHADQRIELNLS